VNITTVGIDLAKNVFQVHAVDVRGKLVLRKQLKRDQVSRCFVNLPPCLIGMEACASSHYWGRMLEGFGHTVRLMAPQFVKPYVKTNKNDMADAEAICEAVARPNMRFVPIKSVEQQAVLSLHRVRQGFVKARTAQANQIRGLLGEMGLVIPQGIRFIAQRVPGILEDASNGLPLAFRQLIERLTNHLKELKEQVDAIQSQIVAWDRGCELSQKLQKIPGIGPLTATALIATIADVHVAWSCAAAKVERREAHAARDQQTRGCLPADPADPRRASRDTCREAQTRGPRKQLARKTACPTARQYRRGRIGE